MTDIDAKLAELLASPASPPDEAFVARVNRAVIAEERIIASQAAIWRRFAAEALGSAAIVTAFYLLWRVAPGDIGVDQLSLAPVAAAGMVLLLWLGTAFKPAAAGK